MNISRVRIFELLPPFALLPMSSSVWGSPSPALCLRGCLDRTWQKKKKGGMEEAAAYLPVPKAVRKCRWVRRAQEEEFIFTLSCWCEVGWGAAGKVASTGSLLDC